MTELRVEPDLAAANERLLVRLGFDLHDGPLQQVHALAQDLHLLREQVLALTGSEYREPLVGRFGDLEAQLTELHQDLRDLAHSLGREVKLEIVGGNQYEVEADFDSASGIKAGATVEIAGVEVGRVRTIKLNEDRAMVVLSIHDNVKLYADTIASITRPFAKMLPLGDSPTSATPSLLRTKRPDLDSVIKNHQPGLTRPRAFGPWPATGLRPVRTPNSLSHCE